MSEAKRAYNLLRAYVNREFDRLKTLDVQSAWRELEGVVGAQSPNPSTTTPGHPGPNQPSNPPTPEKDYTQTARQILGVEPDASFAEIRRAFEKLSRRSQPVNFEPGSPEAEHAQDLLRKATWAYNYLTKDLDPAQKRFRALEID